MEITIYNPSDSPYGELSNNTVHFMNIERKKYPSVSNFIYSHLAAYGSNKEIIRNASTKPPSTSWNIDKKIQDYNNKFYIKSGRQLTPLELASLKKTMLLGTNNRELSLHELTNKCLLSERNIYCMEALNKYFSQMLESAIYGEAFKTALLSTKDNKILYIMESSNRESSKRESSKGESFGMDDSLPLGCNQSGFGENLVGKVLMEIRDKLARDILVNEAQTETDARIDRVFDLFLLKIAFTNLLNKKQYPYYSSIVDEKNALLEDYDKQVKNVEEGKQLLILPYDKKVIYKLFMNREIPFLTKLIEMEEGGDSLSTEQVLKLLKKENARELVSLIDNIKITTVWNLWLRWLIKGKNPEMSSSDIDKNIAHFIYDIPPIDVNGYYEIKSDDVAATTIIRNEKNQIINYTNHELTKKLMDEVYTLYLKGKLPQEVNDKIKSELEKRLKDIEENDDDDDDDRSGSSSSSGSSIESAGSSSSSDDGDVIKSAIREKSSKVNMRDTELLAEKARRTTSKRKLYKIAKSLIHSDPNKSARKSLMDKLDVLYKNDDINGMKKFIASFIKKVPMLLPPTVQEAYQDVLYKKITTLNSDPLLLRKIEQIRQAINTVIGDDITGEALKERQKQIKLLELVYKKILYDKLKIPVPVKEDPVKLLALIKNLSRSNEIIQEATKAAINEDIVALNKLLASALTEAGFRLEKMPKEEAVKERLRIRELTREIRDVLSIVELEQKLGIYQIQEEVLARKDLKELHNIVRLDRKTKSKISMIPLYKQALDSVDGNVSSIKIFNSTNKNSGGLEILSLEYPIKTGMTGYEFVLCTLISKIRTLERADASQIVHIIAGKIRDVLHLQKEFLGVLSAVEFEENPYINGKSIVDAYRRQVILSKGFRKILEELLDTNDESTESLISKFDYQMQLLMQNEKTWNKAIADYNKYIRKLSEETGKSEKVLFDENPMAIDYAGIFARYVTEREELKNILIRYHRTEDNPLIDSSKYLLISPANTPSSIEFIENSSDIGSVDTANRRTNTRRASPPRDLKFIDIPARNSPLRSGSGRSGYYGDSDNDV